MRLNVGIIRDRLRRRRKKRRERKQAKKSGRCWWYPVRILNKTGHIVGK
jgi:hypothetical protein